MKNHHKKALSRKEKIEQARAIKKGVIENPRHLIGLPDDAVVTIRGAASDAFLVRIPKLPPQGQQTALTDRPRLVDMDLGDLEARVFGHVEYAKTITGKF